MKKFAFALTVGLAACGLASNASAWNARGHMVVAAKAWAEMTPTARAEASRLLKLNPSYNRWIAGVPAAERDVTAFAKAATWPDEIKSTYIDDGYDASTAVARQNVGYADRYKHKYWHFKDIAFSPDGTELLDPPAINAVERIQLFAGTLSAPDSNDDLKSYNLAWLLHLVGDIHQPLHATSRFLSVDKDGDDGGNGVTVCLVACSSGKSALHSFWDGALGSSDRVPSVIAKAKALADPSKAKIAISDPNVWAEESFIIARDFAYSGPIQAGLGNYLLTNEYKAVAGSYAERRASLAGWRLANILNAALG